MVGISGGACSPSLYTAGVNIPPGMEIAFQGKADFVREVLQQLKAAGIAAVTGPLPGG